MPPENTTRLLNVLLAIEAVGISAAFSAIAGPRYLSGQRLDYPLAAGRVATPVLTVLCVALMTSMVSMKCTKERIILRPPLKPLW